MQSNFWAGSKYFGTCKRTRHKPHSNKRGNYSVEDTIYLDKYGKSKKKTYQMKGVS